MLARAISWASSRSCTTRARCFTMEGVSILEVKMLQPMGKVEYCQINGDPWDC